jgi:hypothetical protein
MWHIDCSTSVQQSRKEVNELKNAKLFLAALIILGNAAVSMTALAADGVISREEFSDGAYCHIKFPAITNSSVSSDEPVLKSSPSEDVIDFYGPCDEDPAGKDQQSFQQLQRHLQHRLNDSDD